MGANSRDEILRFVLETQGQEGLDALTAALAKSGEVGGASTEKLTALATALGELLDRTKQVESLQQLQDRLADVSTRLAQAKDDLAKFNEQAASESPAAFAKAQKAVADLSEEHDKLAIRVSTSSAALNAAGVDTRNLGAAHDELGNKARAAAEKLAETAARGGGLGAVFNSLHEPVAKVGESLKSVGEFALESGKRLLEISGIAGVVASALAAISGFKFFEKGAEEASSFEQALSRLRAATGATGEQLEHLKEIAETAGEKIGVSGTQSADVLTKLTQSFGSADKGAAALSATLTFAKAAQLDYGEAANLMATAIKAFGLNAEDAGRVGDVLSTVAIKTGINLQDLARNFGQIAPIAKDLGIGFDQTAAALGALASKGFDAEQSGRALRDLFQNLQQPGSKLRQELVGLGIDTGSLSSILDGLHNAGQRGVEALESLDKKGRPAVLALVQSGSAGLRQFNEVIASSAGQAEKTAKILDDTLSGALKDFARDANELAGKTVSEAFGPLKDEVKKLDDELKEVGKTDAFRKIKEDIKDFVAGAVKAFDEFVHTVDWKNLGKDISDWARAAKESLSSVGESISSVQTVFTKFGAAVGAVWNAVKVIFDGIAGATSAVAAGVTNQIAGVAEVLGQFSSYFKQKAAEFRDLAKQYAENAKSFFSGAGDAAVKAADDLAKLATESEKAGTKAADAAPKHTEHAKALEHTAEASHKVAEQFENVVSGIENHLAPSLAKSKEELTNAATALSVLERAGITSGRAVDSLQDLIAHLTSQNRDLTSSVYENEAAYKKAKDAAGALKITLQDDLVKTASELKNAFNEIDRSAAQTAAGMADRREAFLKYAAAVLDATKNLDQGARDSAKYSLENKASALGLSTQLTELEKSYHGVADAAKDATVRIADNAGEMEEAAKKAEKYKNAMGTLTDQNASLEDRTKAASVAIENAATSTEKQRAVAETASVAIQHQKDAATALAAAVTGVQTSFNGVSEAAGQKFTETMDRASQNAGLTKLAVQDVTKSLSALNAAAADTTGFGAYFKALAGAQETVQKEIDSQRESLRAQTTAFENFASSAGASIDDLKTRIGGGTDRLFAMDQALKNGTYDAGLLGQQDLGPLQQAVSAAIAKVNALTQAEQQATQQLADLNAQLQDERDQQLGDATAIENRAYQKRIKDIEDLAAKADAAGKAQAQEELALAEQIHQKKLKDIADQAAAQKQASQPSSGSGTGGGSTSTSNAGTGSNASSAAIPSSTLKLDITINAVNAGSVNLSPADLQNLAGKIIAEAGPQITQAVLAQFRLAQGRS